MSKKQQVKKDEIVFLPLGGSGEIGMNLNLYQYRNKWLMVDLGITFGQDLGIDVWMADTAFIEERRKDLVGLVLTHAHEDHIGAIPYLWERLKCPIYATPFTLQIVKEKLKDVGLLGKVPLHEVPLGGHVNLDPFDVEFVTLTHSILEPNALAIKAGGETVVHTGDWKIDQDPLIGETTDVKRLKELGDEGVLALVCDSTNAFVEGRTGSEAQVREHLCEVVTQQKTGRVAIACFASNVARLESAAVAARESGRAAVLVGRSLVRMDKAARQCGYLKDVPAFLEESEAKNIPPDELLMICTGSQGEPRSALARIASGQHPRAKLEAGDTVIFSSRIIPGNEPDIKALCERLVEKNISVITENRDTLIHVSGHPARDDLKDMYHWVRPEILIPVHGEKAHMREQAKFGAECGIPQTLVPHNGLKIGLDPENLRVIEKVPHGRLALDGNVLVPQINTQLRDRHRIGTTGVIGITLVFKKKKSSELKEPPLVSLIGVTAEGQEEPTIKAIRRDIQDALQQTPQEIIDFDDGLIELVRITARRTVNGLRGKKPLVITHVVRA